MASLDAPVGEKNRVYLVCLPNFASSAVFLNNTERACPLPRDGFLSKLQEDWPSAAADLWQWRDEIWQNCKPDLVCNLTPTVPGRLLARFLAGDAPITGFGLDEYGFGTASPWAAFFQGSSRKRSVSPFNLVDLFRAVAGSSRGLAGDSALAAPEPDINVDKILADGAADAKELKGMVAFQLGASEDRRRWPVEFFAELGDALWHSAGMLPVLLGSADEAALAARYAQHSKSPHLSLAGRTSLQDLARVLLQCRLLVSNDTGTMHLAAGLGCPVLGIFLATAQCWDTGPYQENSCSIEPGLRCHPCAFGTECQNEHICRYAIAPELVTSLAQGFLRHGRWPEAGAAQPDGPMPPFGGEAERARVWRGVKDAFGFMDLQSLSGHAKDARTLWFLEQRDFLRQFLDRDPARQFVYRAPDIGFEFPTAEKEKLAAELAVLNGQLTLLLELGKMLRLKPLPPLRERFVSALHKTSAAFEAASYMLALGLLWRVEVQEQGDNLENALLCIEQYFNLISSLLQRVNG